MTGYAGNAWWESVRSMHRTDGSGSNGVVATNGEGESILLHGTQHCVMNETNARTDQGHIDDAKAFRPGIRAINCRSVPRGRTCGPSTRPLG